MSFQSQRFCILAALGLALPPVVIFGIINTLAMRYAGRIIVTLSHPIVIALVYRIEWSFSLHIICVYHTFILFFWVLVLRNARLIHVAIGTWTRLTLEGVICCLVADFRFLPVHGLHLNQLTPRGWIYLPTYLSLLLVILGSAYVELCRPPPEIGR